MPKSPLSVLIHRNRETLSPMPGPWVDGGCYKGEFIRICKGLFPGRDIYGFEPIPRRVRKLRKAFKEIRVHIHEKALGECDGIRTLHILKGNPYSSLLLPLPELANALGDRGTETEQISVQQVRLDKVLDRPPGLLKLDVQGSEEAALMGGSGFITGIHGLILELSNTLRYKGQASASRLESRLGELGFFCADKESHGGNPNRGDVWDALFLNKRFGGNARSELTF